MANGIDRSMPQEQWCGTAFHETGDGLPEIASIGVSVLLPRLRRGISVSASGAVWRGRAPGTDRQRPRIAGAPNAHAIPNAPSAPGSAPRSAADPTANPQRGTAPGC